MIIIFEGVDKIGKTTLIKNLQKELKNSFYIKSPFLKITKFFINKKFAKYILLLDFLIQYFYIRIIKKKYKYILMDRSLISLFVYQSKSYGECLKLFFLLKRFLYKKNVFYIFLSGKALSNLDDFEKLDYEKRIKKYILIYKILDYNKTYLILDYRRSI